MAPYNKVYALPLLALAAVIQLSAAEGGSGGKDQKPLGPPQPRIIEGEAAIPLPPRPTDPSWLDYQEGLKLVAQKRLGEAQLAFNKAIAERQAVFSQAQTNFESALAVKEAAKIKAGLDNSQKPRDHSVADFLRLLALRDFIPQDYDALHQKASGSLVTEMGLIRERSVSGALRDFIDASLLVVEEGGSSRFGDSLLALRKAVSDLKSYPEAEFQLGKLYLAEGELRLAQLQTDRALSMTVALADPLARYDMLTFQAELCRTKGDLKGYEEQLLEITKNSQLYAPDKEIYRDTMERVLASKGFDTVVKLFKVEDSFAVPAFSRLGALYLQSGRPIATEYLLAAVDATITRMIRQLRVDEPDFEYGSLPDFAQLVTGDAELSSYAEEAEFWNNLVLLGEAAAATGDRDTARELWTVVAKAKKSTATGRKAILDIAKVDSRR